MEIKGPPLGNDGKNSSRNNCDKGNRRLGRMRHERKEQPGMEKGEEVRPFQEERRRGVQRSPFDIGLWRMGDTRVLGLGGSAEMPGGTGRA